MDACLVTGSSNYNRPIMCAARLGATLMHHTRALMLSSPAWAGSISYCQYQYGRHCLQQIALAARQISCLWPRWQRSGVPAVDPALVGELRDRLAFDSEKELRLYWRRAANRLDGARIRNALHVLTTLEKEGVSIERVKQYPGLLKIRPDRLAVQVGTVRRLPAPLSAVLPLVLLRHGQLAPAVRTVCSDHGLFPDCDTRLDYLAGQLQVDLERLCAIFLKNSSILTAPADRVIEITRLLIDGGISPAAILDDPWIYKHNTDVMRERLRRLQETGLQPLRPWMLRCPEHILQEHVDRFQLRRTILSEYGDEVAYLSERLGLGRAQVSAFEHRYPAALRASVMKMKAVLDVLLEFGYNGAQVAEQPRIICYSARRIRERCERLRAAGLRPASLLVLCKTPRDFERYMTAAAGRRAGRAGAEAGSEQEGEATEQGEGSEQKGVVTEQGEGSKQESEATELGEGPKQESVATEQGEGPEQGSVGRSRKNGQSRRMW